MVDLLHEHTLPRCLQQTLDLMWALVADAPSSPPTGPCGEASALGPPPTMVTLSQRRHISNSLSVDTIVKDLVSKIIRIF